MSYADRYRNVRHCDCAKEAGLISELDDALFYCSNKCKNNGDTYRNEVLQNDTPTTEKRAAEKKNNNNKKSIRTCTSGRGGDMDFY